MSKRLAMILVVVGGALVGLVGVLGGMNGRVQAATPNTSATSPDLSPLGTIPFTLDWVSETIDSVGNVGVSYPRTSLALDSNGRPHIAYTDAANEDLVYAHWNGVTWLTATVDSVGNVGEFASLALDNNEYPHISYKDGTNGAVKHAYWNGASWQTEVADASFGTFQFTSIALDSNGYPHISFFDFYYDQLKYAQWDGVSWQVETADNNGWVGEYNSLALDGSDQAHISYVHYNFGPGSDELKYARWTGSSWISETVDVGNVGDYSSLVLDGNGRPHISYYDRGNTALKYAYWDGATWQIETVDSSGEVGWHTSLALNSNGYPYITYYNRGSSYDLKLARWDGQNWRIETVDSQGSVGGANSLALDSEDQLHVSYYDYTNDKLKYAVSQGGTAIIPISGGQMVVTGEITITVPANTFADAVRLHHVSLQPQPVQPHVETFFELSAIYVNSGLPALPDPGQTVNVVVSYKQAEVAKGLCEDRLVLFGWIPKILQRAPDGPGGIWQPVLSSMVNTQSNEVTAELDRLGTHAIFGSYCLHLPIIAR